MKIGIISDLHGFLPDLPEVVDLLIIAGDVCPVRDHTEQRQINWIGDEFGPWLDSLSAHNIIGVAGNHDFVLEKFSFPNLPWTYLQNSAAIFEGLKVWGTPLSGRFGKWAFMRDEDDLERVFVEIPSDSDIIISHGPPKGYGDECQNGYHAGSPSLLQRLGLVQPQLTVVGHIHEARGIYPAGWSTVVNAAAVDLNYGLRPNPYTFVYL